MDVDAIMLALLLVGENERGSRIAGNWELLAGFRQFSHGNRTLLLSTILAGL